MDLWHYAQMPFKFNGFYWAWVRSGGSVTQCMCTEPLTVCFNIFFFNLFFKVWLNILWFVWVFYCSVCIFEYLFKTLKVSMCGMVVFALTKYCSAIFILWMGVLHIKFICLCCVFIFIFLWERNSVINTKTFFS